MSNHADMIALIRGMAGQANILTIPRIFIDLVGGVEAALFLNQCIYWSDKSRRNDGWFYKTRAQWQAEIGISEWRLRRVRVDVSAYVEERPTEINGRPCVLFRVKFEALVDGLNALASQPQPLEETSPVPDESFSTETIEIPFENFEVPCENLEEPCENLTVPCENITVPLRNPQGTLENSSHLLTETTTVTRAETTQNRCGDEKPIPAPEWFTGKVPEFRTQPSPEAQAYISRASRALAAGIMAHHPEEPDLAGLPERVHDVARAFMIRFKRGPVSRSERNFWLKSWGTQVDLGLCGADIENAIAYMLENHLTIKSPESVTATAYSRHVQATSATERRWEAANRRASEVA